MTGPLLLLDHLAGPLGRLGIDYPRFRAILGVRLALDERRQHGWVQGSRRVSALTWSLLVHGLMGLWIAILPFVMPSALTAMTLGLSVVMVMLVFDLVADYSAVLLDPADASVLGARPVDARTVFAARLAHVAVYLVMYVGALAAATVLAGTLRWGTVFLPVYLATLAGVVILVLGGVSLVYLGIMWLVARRIVGAGRVRDLTMWAQVGMTLVTVVGYYVLSTVDLARWSALDWAPWIHLYPPAWMAGLVALAVGEVGAPQAGLAATGVVAPPAVGLLALRLAPAFRPGAAPALPVGRRRGRGRVALGRRLARRVVISPESRAVFDLVWTLMARNRQFKARTYPALAAIVFFVGAFVLAAHEGAWREQLGPLPDTRMHLFLLYYAILVIPTPLLMVPYVERPEAAWIWRSLPIARPGSVLLVAVVVIFMRLVVPVFAVLAAVILAIWGAGVLVDVAFAFAATALVTTCLAIMVERRLPFAHPPPGGASATTAGTIFASMLLVGVVAAAHWGLASLATPLPQPWPVGLAIPVVLLGAWRAGRAAAATTWPQVQSLGSSAR